MSGFCKHYVAILGPGMIANRECEKGVNYLKHAGCEAAATPGWIKRLPCFGDRLDVVPCRHREMPSQEEVLAEELEIRETIKLVAMVRSKITSAGLKSGQMDCPKCEGVGTLAFSVSDRNGHIHAKCQSEGCTFGWIE
jgi:hypothetical protein